MNADSKRRPTRREFVGILGGGAASLLGLRLVANGIGDGSDRAADGDRAVRPKALDARAIKAAVPASRVLVVLEMNGGNDGLSTVVPFGDPAYRTLRKATAIDAEEVVRIDNMFGYNPQLSLLAPRLAAVQGVGALNPSGSHFDMSARWWAGDAAGAHGLTTGFLGRLCDVLDQGAPVTGVSLAGVTPALLSDKAVTVGMPGIGQLQWLLSDEPWYRNLRRGFMDLSTKAPDDAPATTHARVGLGRALDFGTLLDDLGEPGRDERDAYPGSPLGEQLRTAAALIGARAGVRVVHTMIGGFDTHANQRGAHDERMREVAEALAAFVADLERRNLADSVLVATTSEFGRRPKENNSGTDHGSASCALLLGPVRPGLHGEPPSLTALDAEDNLRSSTTFEDYYATLAEGWFGIDATKVLPTKPKPIEGLLNV